MNDIYEQVISKQNEVLAANQGSDVNTKADELITLLMDNFPGIPTVDDVSRIFFGREDGDKLDTLDINILKSLPVELVPFAVIRYMLATKKAAFYPVQCAAWTRFADAYGDVILRA